ncbi:MAG: ABC transporter substrate-binding protein [Victivallaceae bacterium]|nr:ABC transporter substrate-binding protein [Victivallaceae bacterium]
MKHWLFSLIALTALTFSGCHTGLPLRINPEEKTRRAVPLAIITPLDGVNAVYGQQMVRGAEMAADEFNHGRGINGRPVELLVIDSTKVSDPVQDAVNRGAVGLIAGYNTSEVGSLLDAAGAARLPTVIPLSTADDQLGANPFIFRNVYTDTQQAEAIAGYLWYWRQLLRISVMVDLAPDAEYERNTARAVTEAFRDLGGGVIDSVEYHGDDYADAIKKLLAGNPQAIMVPAPGRRSAKIIKTLRNLGFGGIICGPDSWDDADLLDELDHFEKLGDCVFISFFSGNNPIFEAKKFRDDFLAKYNYEPGACETQTFDATKMLAIALNGAYTIGDFEENWQRFINYFGVAAIYTMLPHGDIDRTMYVKTAVVNKGPYPTFKLIRRFQHSKLKTYQNDEE